MLDFGLLNVGSLLLGLIAWALPVANLCREKKAGNHSWVVLTMVSFIACAVSIIFQVFYSLHLVNIEDWSALMDTQGAVAKISVLLLTVTIILNVMTLIVYRDKTTLITNEKRH